MAEENQNKIAQLDQKLAEVKTVKDLFALEDFRLRFIKNFQSVTSRKDGENRFEQEKFAYFEILNEKPELKSAPMFSHMSALMKAATTGLSFRDGKLYVQPVKRGDQITALKVTSSPAGKREQFELMEEVKEAPEAQVVVKGDIFIYDKLNMKIIKHESTEKSMSEDMLENITHSYQRIIYKDGRIRDVVVTYAALVQAKKKSKIKSTDSGLWIDFPAEAAKKTATNRAHRLYHKYPDNVVVYGNEEADETIDADHEIEDNYQPEASENVDTDTGEIHEPTNVKVEVAEPVASEPVIEKATKKRTAVQGDLL